MIDEDLFEPYQKLIEIEILAKKVEVPENNKLLRCFQYLSIETISFGDFCWNGECNNCQIWYCLNEENSERTTLSCRTKVSEGMVITKLSQHIKLQGINK
jgi:predicted molibdopterin-dependent oxidoreductase YjgC